MAEKFSLGTRIVLILVVIAVLVLVVYVHKDEQEELSSAANAEKAFSCLAAKINDLNDRVTILEKHRK